jgi:hypothetical protein
MRLRTVILLLLCGLMLGPLSPAPAQQPQAPGAEMRWFRGNTHTHTIHTDGDSSPDAVVRWYKEHGYHFVVLTDHDYLTPVDGLNAVFAAPGKFLVIPGVEVTDRYRQGETSKPVHLNGIGVREAVKPMGGATITEMLDNNARAVRAVGGIAQINHPNFGWALTAEEIAATREPQLLELWNAHPLVNNHGGGGSPSTEEIWDAVLTAGRRIFAVASDDAHQFQGEFSRERLNPGRAWVMVRAPELSTSAIHAALERGDFYASTGVLLRTYIVDAKGIRLELPEGARGSPARYRTFFIGKGGEVLKRDESLAPSYEFRGDELYVRARVEASTGAMAWTQPVFPPPR